MDRCSPPFQLVAQLSCSPALVPSGPVGQPARRRLSIPPALPAARRRPVRGALIHHVHATRRAPASDPWRDAEGNHISLQCRVEQVAVDKIHGALRDRLHERGQVIGRGPHLIYVLFDRADQLIALRPHHVRVIDGSDAGAGSGGVR